MKKSISVLAVFLLSLFGFSSFALANCEIKVCHCSASKLDSSRVGLNNLDGNGIYDRTTIDRGSCKTMKGTITGCFVVFKHYATDATKTTDSALASGEVAFGWIDNPDTDAEYEYVLSYGGTCDK
ncbi:MAG: hypothetical protein AAF410_00450 [Pseudomonadota bacterium]